ncbi:MAG: peptide deformylase [Dokdonia sp.]|jgi:peptide deformylase
MILPIIAYGDPVLKKKAKPITKDYPKLPELIDNMFETMYGANGLGLAAPQVGLSIRMFLVDTSPFANDNEFTDEEKAIYKDFKKVFINAEIVDREGDEWVFNEGCLSIPGITEGVFRESTITIKYQDENFKEYTETYDGIIARVIQHEYDHIEGVLFIDKLSSLKKRILKGRLANISKGKCEADYRMRFPDVSKKR